ncbi:hypothetical protein AMECASPLE_033087 [Ameca splendens]|uniref:Uncharacterized protein n=1 Tax=Ameca splendens TaxID=208324 RepID=A0ABV0Z6C0_9TELE
MERKGLQQTLCFLTYHSLVIPKADELVELPQISLFSVFPNTKTYVEVLLNTNSIHTHPGNSSSSAMRHTSIQLHVSILRVSVVETACSAFAVSAQRCRKSRLIFLEVLINALIWHRSQGDQQL